MKLLQHFLYVYLGIAILFLFVFAMLFLGYFFFSDVTLIIETITWKDTKMILGIYMIAGFVIALLSAD